MKIPVVRYMRPYEEPLTQNSAEKFNEFLWKSGCDETDFNLELKYVSRVSQARHRAALNLHEKKLHSLQVSSLEELLPDVHIFRAPKPATVKVAKEQHADAMANRLHSESETLEALFAEFVLEWKKDTLFESSMIAKLMHPAYYKIIALGEHVIPLILREMERMPGHWFVALEALTRTNPVAADANFSQATEAWLKWGRDQGFI